MSRITSKRNYRPLDKIADNRALPDTMDCQLDLRTGWKSRQTLPSHPVHPYLSLRMVQHLHLDYHWDSRLLLSRHHGQPPICMHAHQQKLGYSGRGTLHREAGSVHRHSYCQHCYRCAPIHLTNPDDMEFADASSSEAVVRGHVHRCLSVCSWPVLDNRFFIDGTDSGSTGLSYRLLFDV